MAESTTKLETPRSIPEQVLEAFLGELANHGTPAHVVAALRKTLLDDGDFSEEAIRGALFARAQLP